MIFLVRHGSANPDSEEHELTGLGLEQAKKLALSLSRFEFSKVYSSSSTRALETFREYNKISGSNAEITNECKEVTRVLVGGPLNESETPERKNKDLERGEAFFSKVLNEEGDVLVFCHGNFIRLLLSMALGISPEKMWGVMIDNCSITIIHSDKRVQLVNSTGHLKG